MNYPTIRQLFLKPKTTQNNRTMKTTSLYILLLFIAFGCSKTTQQQITDSKDYQKFLITSQNIAQENALKERQFWIDKLKATPNQYPYLQKIAAANTQLFNSTGSINYLKEAENNLLIANEKTNYNNAGFLRSLARNYVSQHRFKEALSLLKKAEMNGEKLQLTEFQLIDVYLELGNDKKAEHYLSNVKDFESFEYLIRISKFNDALGNLDNAIQYLEKALLKVENSSNIELLEWTYTNLSDYYGHAGRLQESYDSYLKALNLNPNNNYAKKGIAWIVFSHEKNAKEALNILAAIPKETMAPDIHLMKAEIADFMGNIDEKEAQINQYFGKVTNENYGVMYSKYNVLLMVENASTISDAIIIAKQEVEARPTAQSYDLLAWAYFKNGDVKKALEIVEKHVLNHTFEPEALLHAAQILKANNRVKEAQLLKKELLASTFELGPNAKQEIENL